MEGRRSRTRNRDESAPKQHKNIITARNKEQPRKSQHHLSPAALLEMAQHQQRHAVRSNRPSGAQRCQEARSARTQAHRQTIDKCIRYLLVRQWAHTIATLRNLLDYEVHIDQDYYQGLSFFSIWQELIQKSAPIKQILGIVRRNPFDLLLLSEAMQLKEDGGSSMREVVEWYAKQSHKTYQFRVNLGMLYLIMGQKELACAQFEQSISDLPNEVGIQSLLDRHKIPNSHQQLP